MGCSIEIDAIFDSYADSFYYGGRERERVRDPAE